MFPLDMFTQKRYWEKLSRVNEVLERVNLKDANNKFPAMRSAADEKSVWRWPGHWYLNPKYLFCDEPNSGLDPQTSLVIDQLISELTKEYNITTVINTHDMNTSNGKRRPYCIYAHQGKSNGKALIKISYSAKTNC